MIRKIPVAIGADEPYFFGLHGPNVYAQSMESAEPFKVGTFCP